MGFNKLGSTVISYTEFTETLFGNEFQTKTDFNSTTRYLKLIGLGRINAKGF